MLSTLQQVNGPRPGEVKGGGEVQGSATVSDVKDLPGPAAKPSHDLAREYPHANTHEARSDAKTAPPHAYPHPYTPVLPPAAAAHPNTNTALDGRFAQYYPHARDYQPAPYPPAYSQAMGASHPFGSAFYQPQQLGQPAPDQNSYYSQRANPEYLQKDSTYTHPSFRPHSPPMQENQLKSSQARDTFGGDRENVVQRPQGPTVNAATKLSGMASSHKEKPAARAIKAAAKTSATVKRNTTAASCAFCLFTFVCCLFRGLFGCVFYL